MSILSQRIKEGRKAKNLTQEELGKICGMTKYTISLYESGKSTPNDEVKKILADYFNVSIDYLLGHSDVRNPYINIQDNKLEQSKNTKKELETLDEKLQENKKGEESDESELATTEMIIDKLIEEGLLKDDEIDDRIANMLLNSLKIDIELKLNKKKKDTSS